VLFSAGQGRKGGKGMNMDSAGYLVAEIRLEKRDDCLHVFSEELPGFHLAVKTTDRYDETDLCRAVEWYFKTIRKMNIHAERAASPLELLGKRLEDVRRVVMTPEFAVA
jgi:hypothetical protein